MNALLCITGKSEEVRAMRCFTRRSGGLRPEPIFVVSALRAPAAIARGRNKVSSTFKVVGIGFLAFVGLLLLGTATSWFGLVTQRPMAKFQEETRKEVYDTSRQYQQGTNRDVARYCEQMRTAPNSAAKKAVAALIRSTLSTYDGPLSDDNRSCASEAGA